MSAHLHIVEEHLTGSGDADPSCPTCGYPPRLVAEEVHDLCSLLHLADRVLVVSPDEDSIAVRLLALGLEELGLPTEVVSVRTIARVRPHDTVVVVCGAAPEAGMTALLAPVLQARAVLLAVTTSEAGDLASLADAVITLPVGPARAAPLGDRPPTELADAAAVLAVGAVQRELRRRRPPPP